MDRQIDELTISVIYVPSNVKLTGVEKTPTLSLKSLARTEKEYSSFFFKSVTSRLVFSVVNSLILDVFNASNKLTLKFLTFSMDPLIIDQYNITIVKSTALKEGWKIRIVDFPKGYDLLFNDIIQYCTFN